VNKGKQIADKPFERAVFTDEQDMANIKDDAIFSETFNFRRNAIDELAKRYKHRAIPVIREVIAASSSLTGQDNEAFLRYCQLLIEEMEESPKGSKSHPAHRYSI
jgi:hypothetical protein